MRINYVDRGPTPYELVEQYGYDWDSELGSYPIWDETKRKWLNDLIYGEFQYREIAQDTGYEFFKWMRIRLNQIMPTINPVAAAALGYDDAKKDFTVTGHSTQHVGSTYENSSESTGSTEYTNTSKGDTSENSKGTSTLATENTANGTGKSTVLNSTTPQIQLTSDQNYMDALQESGSTNESTANEKQSGNTETSATGSSTRNDTGTGSNTNTGETSGKQEQETETTQQAGTYAQLASDWIANAPDILGTIFAGLESCFVQVWW